MSEPREFATTAAESEAVTPPIQEMAGLHAGAIVFLGIGVANVCNYAFHLISARALGPSGYADVASLVALAGLISLPLGGIQVIVARRVATRWAERRPEAVTAFARKAIAASLAIGLAFAAILVSASGVLAEELSIDSVAAVALTAALAAPAVLTPVLWGLAQGLQQFSVLAVAMGAAPVVRVIALVALLGSGSGVAGALAATLIGALLGIVWPAWALRHWLRKAPTVAETPIDRASPVREFAPVLIGLLAITSLTTVDVIVAKAVLDDDVAGIYASASIIARVILYLPAAIVTVLLPKVSFRVASGDDPRSIFALSMAVTIAFCLAALLVYSFASSLVTTVAFGSGYENVAGVLPEFAAAMTLFAILNVQLAYHLGRGSVWMPTLLAGGALLHLVALTFIHATPFQLIMVGICVGAGLLVIHELFLERTLVPALRALRAVSRRRPLSRAA